MMKENAVGISTNVVEMFCKSKEQIQKRMKTWEEN